MRPHTYWLQADIAFGDRNGCQPPPQLPNRWPLGLDRLKELGDSDAEGHLLAFLCSIAKDYEPRNNLSQYMLFGPRVFHTLHPKNLETILSTNFQGTPLCQLSLVKNGFNHLRQTMTLGYGMVFSPLFWGLEFLRKMAWLGSIRGKFCESSLLEHSIRI
jgi:hypothetical protein